MKTFFLSGHGRLLTFAIGVALAGSGAGKLMEGPEGIAVGCIAYLAAVVLTIFALGTGLGEHFGAAVLAAVLLPCLALLGQVGLGLMPHSAGVPLVMAGLLAFALAARRPDARILRPARVALFHGT